MRSGRLPKVVAAFAVHNAPAIGSVQPMAGTTSLLTSEIMRSLIFFSCIFIYESRTFYFNQEYSYYLENFPIASGTFLLRQEQFYYSENTPIIFQD